MYPTEDTRSPSQARVDDDRTMLRDFDEPATSHVGEALAPNVLKSRFVLEEQLGSGGMGTVYRAKDLRKVEAQDRQPYLAIKVLNGDFRQHPDAFIALQREAAKSQSLSHQNIVKIFDFDKDGDVPFMTMELLQGNELADLLRQYPQGLPETLGWDLIKGFCGALRHAHAEGVIHADLKPGNLFVTHTGQVKIFDFGLARAVHANFSEGVLRTRGDVEDLIFDAAGLGALTPAFATKAMLQGASPTASDDLFAAALVIYQILTGKHPYNRIPADKVDPRTVALDRPRHLSSRQWRALQSALALDQENRLASVADLEAALFEKSPWPMRFLAIGLGTIAALMWAANLQKDDEIRAVQEQAVQAGRVEAGLDRILELIQLPSFDVAWEQRVDDELSRLSRLPDAESVHGSATAQISSLYVGRIIATGDLAEAAELAARGEKFGDMSAGWEAIALGYLDKLEALLDAPSPSTEWLSAVEETLSAILRLSPDRHAAALAQVEVNASYLFLLDERAASIPESVSLPTLELLADREFELDRVEALRGSLVRKAESAVQEMQRDQARLDVAAFGASFQKEGCLIAGLPELKSLHTTLRSSGEVSRSALAARTDKVMARCVATLRAIDPDGAASLKREALNTFGALPRTMAVRLDPCDRDYLVGAGQRGGRSGSCKDSIAGAPELVVVALNGTTLAVTRYEVSVAEYSQFCTATNRASCSAGDPDIPALNLSVSDALDYSSWLSEQTGFTYRLPTQDEWLNFSLAGSQAPDANRNCRVELGGVVRGGAAVRASVGEPNKLGLVNTFGNAAEWATHGQNFVSVGGDFNTPIESCSKGSIKLSDGEGSPTQGLRLVREMAYSSQGPGT